MLQTFDFNENPVRALERDGSPWFVAADVCRVLEIGNPRDAVATLEEDEKDGVGITDAIGREQITNCINESGLYALIFKSRKKAAKEFRKWVTSVVLPSIRKNGFYLQSGLDFDQYPVCREYSDIYHWLRTLQIDDPNECSRSARQLLSLHLKQSRSRGEEKGLISYEDRRDFEKLIELLPGKEEVKPFFPTELQALCRRNGLFSEVFRMAQSDDAMRSVLGRKLHQFVNLVVGSHVMSVHRSRNWRRYIFTKVSK